MEIVEVAEIRRVLTGRSGGQEDLLGSVTVVLSPAGSGHPCFARTLRTTAKP
jgi:hypothetical protein